MTGRESNLVRGRLHPGMSSASIYPRFAGRSEVRPIWRA